MSSRAERMVMVSVPEAEPGRKCWAKALTDVDPGKDGGYAFNGPWLEQGAIYRLPAGTMIVTAVRATRHPYQVRVSLWQADAGAEGGLALVKTWTNKKGRIGAQIIKGIASRRRKARPPHPPVCLEPFLQPAPRPNRWADTCDKCHRIVDVGKGIMAWRRDGRVTVTHITCPPLRNSYPDTCGICAGWIRAGEGVLVPASPDHVDRHIVTDPAGKYGRPRTGRWRVVHVGRCPENPEPRPERKRRDASGPRPNRRPGPCEICWQRVPAGEGMLDGADGNWHLVHAEECPPNPYNPDGAPTWVIRGDDDHPVGTVARVALDDGPADGPGWRITPDWQVSVIGVVTVVAVERRPGSHPMDPWSETVVSVWRVATPEEAAPVLDREAQRLERAGLAARARRLLALLPGATPDDAVAPPVEEMDQVALAGLPMVPVPLGASHPETVVRVDEAAGLVWTVVHNAARDDDWSLSNWGGYIAYRHPLTEPRQTLIEQLRSEDSSDA